MDYSAFRGRQRDADPVDNSQSVDNLQRWRQKAKSAEKRLQVARSPKHGRTWLESGREVAGS